ncbi:hypothetical protein GMORB2_5351 [Geosmithia morbida]|uniref:Uncharacterized protein n=1 Tax=Geosmithia morbida TaxID=1094350 RepID=A0A9P5D6E8_9HYPO|nr:uncharacterized protein GMORB2_5351 [Geosmithia morbida]KAF4124685.1 hypothetical protein GMORB2_5351 [Geosmithia morbida]
MSDHDTTTASAAGMKQLRLVGAYIDNARTTTRVPWRP